MARPLYINGRFLTRAVTGTQRFAREIVWALDAHLVAQGADREVVLLAPPGTPKPEGLQVLQFRTCGQHQGHLWEQWDLYRAAKDGQLLSLTNSGPILHLRQTVVIHDALVYRMPMDYALPYRLFHQTLGRILARRARLVTVSTFSRAELAEIFHLEPQKIMIVYNGHEHILAQEQDDGVLDRLGIGERTFFLFVGSPALRKNLNRAIEAFKILGREDIAFVVVGAANARVFSGTLGELPANVIRAGHLADAEIIALYRHALALVFPSLYEGFGIPPLEAMALGCPALVGCIPPVEEVCGDAAVYYDAYGADVIAQSMRDAIEGRIDLAKLRARGKTRLPLFTWHDGAIKIWEDLCQRDK
jgi:glycosyltransferase involved in cell wall biosynthesis